MFRRCSVADPYSAYQYFNLREIVGRWVSTSGAPAVVIYRNTVQKWKGIRLRLTYNNPQAVCDCAVKNVFGQHYIELYGHINLAYDRERDVLIISSYGEYVRVEDSAEN